METLLILLAVAGAQDAPGPASPEPPLPYATAYERAASTGTPLVAVVTASSWCPACRVLERDVLPGLLASPRRSSVALTLVDQDKLPETAQSLLGGPNQPVPQVVVWQRAGGKWSVRRLVGVQPLQKTLAFIFKE